MIVFGKFHLYRNICFVHPKLLVNIVAVEGDEHPVMTEGWDCNRQVLKYLHSFCIPMDIDLQIDHEYLSLGGQRSWSVSKGSSN